MICEPVNIDGGVDVKRCSRCHEIKPASAFNKRSDRKSGLQSRCKSCDVEYRAERPKKVFESYPDFKTCNKCGYSLPSSEFSKKPDSSDGLGYTCRACERLRHERRASAPKKAIERKTCSSCKEDKGHVEFAIHKYSVDGHASICKECDRRAHKILSLVEKIPPKTKECKSCGIIKLSTEFYRNAGSKDGLQQDCSDCQSLQASQWRKDNPDKHAAQVSRRRSAKYRATPPWVDKIMMKQINWFFAASKMMTETTGVIHHVDHIHPLRGKNFSGLNVPWNLRVIKGSDNSKKTNKPPIEESHMFFHPSIEFGGTYGIK